MKTLYILFKNIFIYLTPRLRRRLYIVLGLILVMGLVEMGALGVIALFISAATDSASVMNSTIILKLQAFPGGEYLTDHRNLIGVLGLATVAAVLLKNLLAACQIYLGGRVAARIDGHFGDLLLSGFLDNDYQWHLSKNSADLVTTITWRNYMGNVTTFMGIQVISDGVVMLMLLVSVFVVAPLVSVCIFCVLGLTSSLIFRGIRPKLDRTARNLRDMEMRINRHSTMALHGIKDVKVFGRSNAFMRGYRRYIQDYALGWARVRILARSPGLLLETVGFVMLTSVILAMMFWFPTSSARITGTIALIAVAAWRILPAVNRMLIGVTTIRQNLPYTRRVLGYLQEMESFRAGVKQRTIDEPFSFNRDLSIRDVEFKYQGADKTVFSGLDLSIQKGALIGVVGHSGAGKTTLVDLIIGLLQPTAGHIDVDGQPLDQSIMSSWMSKIGYVSQNPYIYDGTLAENIAFGLEPGEIDRDKVLACCQQAAVSEFLPDLPNGIDTPIGERGTRLSGGQRQRVAIARALYRDIEILVLDEATSALDTKSEIAIQRAIKALAGHLTVIIIAHRLETVEDCDTVIWLEKGRMRESGPAMDVLTRYRSSMKDQEFTQEVTG
jgi:ABC-type multidrug transport system fused ATPase/permease subunit